MKALFFILTMISVMLFTSCVMGIPTYEDQIASLEPYQEVKIGRSVYTTSAHSAGKSQTWRRLSPPEYLSKHAGIVINARNRKSIELALIDDVYGNRGVQIDNAASGGGCALVSGDGYCITASHVVGKHRDNDRAFYLSEEEGRLIVSDYRVVFRDEQADFAIIKTSIKSRHYLRPRKQDLSPGDLLFGGSRVNEYAAGRFEEVTAWADSEHHKKPVFQVIQTSMPLRPGDSGSPIIDRDGALCGVAVSISVGIFKNDQPAQSRAVMMDAGMMYQIIAEDRLAQ